MNQVDAPKLSKKLEPGLALPPLFIPLKKEFFEQFLEGTKTQEFRKYGKRWNENVCQIGRPVILSCGYGKQQRMTGEITEFRIGVNPQKLPGWLECYGSDDAPAACIKIKILQ